MRLVRTLAAIPPHLRGGVIALGNFDGVHLGHRAVIGTARDIARRVGAPHGVMTFEPHPRSFFRPAQPPFRIASPEAKERLIRDLGVDLLHVQDFDAAFAGLSAADFIRHVLVDGLAARHVVVGHDYAFGRGRAGTTEVLRQASRAGAFGVSVVGPVTAPQGHVYSSTRIRELLRDGRPREAAALLGRPWEIAGRLETGNRLPLGDHLRPAVGTYEVRVSCENGPFRTGHARLFGDALYLLGEDRTGRCVRMTLNGLLCDLGEGAVA